MVADLIVSQRTGNDLGLEPNTAVSVAKFPIGCTRDLRQDAEVLELANCLKAE